MRVYKTNIIVMRQSHLISLDTVISSIMLDTGCAVHYFVHSKLLTWCTWCWSV